MSNSKEKNCPKCNAVFECNTTSIQLCQCIAVKINQSETNYLKNKYMDCLCVNCITKEKAEFHKQKNNIMTLEEKIEQSETRIFKAVFPNTTNHYDTLFGGTAMQLLDEVAFITATRFARKRVVTVSSERIDFKKSIPAGTIIELIGKVKRVGNTSLTTFVEIYIEEMYSNSREKAITGEFTFVAIDENKNPISVL